MQSIPKVIHQTWKSSEIPAELGLLQESWKIHHPDWTYRLWTDEDNRQFLQAYYPWFLKTYDSYQDHICRVDAVRYFILMHYGGVFIDLDFECLRSLNELLLAREVVIGLEPPEHVDLAQPQIRGLTRILCPSLMASQPGHPFFQFLCQRLAKTCHYPGVLDATGPFFLTRAYEGYSSQDLIYLVPYPLLYPATKFDCWEGKLNQTEFRQKIAQEAFAIHHWHGTWFRPQSIQTTPKTDSKTQTTVPLALMVQGRIILRSELRHHLYQSLSFQESEKPLISCIMVTKHRFEQAKIAIRCFQNQTYANKQLVIVDDDESDHLANYINQLGDATIHHLHLKPQNQTLGELRNIALANTLGSYVCQWDDDDLADPLRLEMQMSTLQVLKADACFLQSWLMWWVNQPRLATSRTRIWEGSILCRKEKMPPYPDQQQGEDTLVTAQILRNCRVALLDQPQLYLYTVHSQNTFNNEHFEQHWQLSSIRHTDGQYYVLLDNLAARMPIIEYVQALELKFPTFPIEVEQSDHGQQPLVASDAQTTTFNSLDFTQLPSMLILTPVKNAVSFLPQYLDNLFDLSYPQNKLSIGFLESDSTDGSFEWLQQHIFGLKKEFKNAYLFKQDFQFPPNLPRWDASIQYKRRSILAKSRNRLLQKALTDEDWVLWLDADVIKYPDDVIQQLLHPGKDIIVPHCVVGEEKRSFDLNTFKFQSGENNRDWTPYLIDGIIQPPRGEGRLYLENMRHESITKVDSVGGTMLLIKADLHRDGLLFPPFSYKQYVETEGLAMMAKDMGYSCWALPNLEIVHASI